MGETELHQSRLDVEVFVVTRVTMNEGRFTNPEINSKARNVAFLVYLLYISLFIFGVQTYSAACSSVFQLPKHN